MSSDKRLHRLSDGTPMVLTAARRRPDWSVSAQIRLQLEQPEKRHGDIRISYAKPLDASIEN
ncbi:hypothetical protein AB6Q56_03155 [Dechloromonas sp. ARDL1]|uniref:hypothetical protein n=1 Tax=Dechloromonas sp. ARDL1 TaxID=3322121 RepID=UPI003DA72D6E